MKNMKYVEAIREALREEMLRDQRVFLIGEAIGGKQEGVWEKWISRNSLRKCVPDWNR